MKTARTYTPGYALLAGLLLTASSGVQAVDNNLHFYGNLLSKSCTLVVDGANLAEIHFPTVSNRDLMVAGQSAHLPVVFKLKDCKGPAGYNVKVTLSGTEDSGQPGFLPPRPLRPARCRCRVRSGAVQRRGRLAVGRRSAIT